MDRQSNKDKILNQIRLEQQKMEADLKLGGKYDWFTKSNFPKMKETEEAYCKAVKQLKQLTQNRDPVIRVTICQMFKGTQYLPC